jgi:hypothetical protein
MSKAKELTRLLIEGSTAYDVYLNNKLIDTVFQSGPSTPEEVKKSLINHDGYDPGIVVKKARKKKEGCDEQRGKNKAVDTKGKMADKLAAKCEEEDTLELNDILERVKSDTASVEKLIEDNLFYAIERDLGNGTVKHVSSTIQSGGEDTLLGNYEVYFKDGSDFTGNFLADGIMDDEAGEYELVSLTFGSDKLMYFGA